MIARYKPDCPEVADYLEEARANIVAHAADFRAGSLEQAAAADADPGIDPLLRFQVNVLVEQGPAHGAPVVFETNPTFMNLVGRIERDVQLGENVLDFTMLRAGALHRANGGYLVLRAADVLKDVNAWDALKRALLTGQIVIEDPGTHLQMFSTRTLESEPIPLNVKVMLLGPPHLYYDLYQYDEEFARLFKVKAEFASEMPRTPENEQAYALFVRARCAEHDLPPFEAGAVAQIVEYGSRAVEDQTKLSTQFGDIADLIIEAAGQRRQRNEGRPRRAVLHGLPQSDSPILGHAQLVPVEDAKTLERLAVPGYRARVERGFLVRIEGFDWNCPHHITPRFTLAEIEEATAPLHRRIKELESR